jgi:hypothetical protein
MPNLDLDATVDNIDLAAAIRTATNLDLANTTDAAVENSMVNGTDEMLDIDEALLMFASANEAV